MVVAECYFVDVGQGVSQVVDVGDGSAIVIDCGRSARVVRELLLGLNISRIALLVLSHNDLDHAGGVVGLINQFGNQIHRICLPQDRPAKELIDRKVYDYIVHASQKGMIPRPFRLEKSEHSQVLYPPDPNTSNLLRLEIVYPDFGQNIVAQVSGRANASCGVLLLHCGQRRILFSGDAEIDVWREIHQQRGGKPIQCDILTVPHHGGQIVRHANRGESYDELHAKIEADLAWLYREAINSKHAIISVGTANPYGDQHPLPPHLTALSSTGTIALCTQITRRCCDELESLRPGVLEPSFPGQSKKYEARTNKGRSRDVACAGTILIEIDPDVVHVSRLEEHQHEIDAKLLAPSGHPLCRLRKE